MKRLKLTIILSIILIFSFSLTSFASGVGGAGESLGVVEGSGIDPRSDARYSSLFNYDASGLYYHGDIVIEYKKKIEDKIYILRTYQRVYTSSERYGLVITSNSGTGYQNDCAYGRIRYGETVKIATASETTSGTFYTDFKDKTYDFVCDFGFFSGTYSSVLDCYDAEIVECSVPVFNNLDDLNYYFETGIIRNAAYDPTVHYSGDDLYFKDFRVIPHVSTLFSDYYFDVYYELSEFALANIDTLNMRVDNDYRISIRRAGVLDDEAYRNNSSMSIALKGKENGFKLYLPDFRSISYVTSIYDFTQNDVLGHHGRTDDTETRDTITYSNLYLRFYLRCNTSSGFKQSKRNDYNHDFLSNKGDASVWVPTSDSSLNGNFDYTQEGDTVTSNSYYYNEVTTNENGDKVNKYYYVDNGKKIEITENEYNDNKYSFDINSGGGGSGGGSSSSSSGGAVANASVGNITVNVGNQGEYVSISPVDFNMFVKGFKDMLEELNVKGGLFSLLKDVFSIFPDEVSTIMIGAISAIAIVSFICIARR